MVDSICILQQVPPKRRLLPDSRCRIRQLMLSAAQRFITGFSPLKPGFIPSASHVGLAAGKVMLEQVFLQALRCSPARCHYTGCYSCPVVAALPRSSVGIATRYGLDAPQMESRWERGFSQTPTPALGSIQPPVQWVPGPLFQG